MRTFIAVPLPSECRDALESLQRHLRTAGAEVRWTAVPSIHLTLKFLGEIDPADLPRLEQTLRPCAETASFSLSLGGVGGFPNLRNPRVLWCGIEGETEMLAQLHGCVESACVSLGYEREDRAFHPHLTLGRVRGRRNLHRLLEQVDSAPAPERRFAVHCFNVYKSTLTPRGALYEILASLDLRR